MSFKVLQLSPHAASTRAVRFNVVPERWTSGYPGESSFLRSWVEDDSDFAGAVAQHRTNWGAISGLALSFAISGGFWAGLALLVTRVLK